MSVPEPPLATSPAPTDGKTVFNLLSNIKDRETSINRSQVIEPDEDIAILRHDPETNENVINKTAYLKLHKSLSPNISNTVDKIKEKFESQSEKIETIESLKTKYSPFALGYSSSKPSVKPRRSRLSKSQIITPSKREISVRRSLNIEPNKHKDVNSNDLLKNEQHAEYITIITRSDSDESVNKIVNELSVFTMEKKKSTSSLRKIFAVFNGRRNKAKTEDRQNGDNLQNESAFSRQSAFRHTTGAERNNSKLQRRDSNHKDIERDFAQVHISEFSQTKPENNIQRNQFTPMDKPSYNTYMNVPNVKKYIDTSSSASTLESDRSNLHQKPTQEGEVDIRSHSSFRPTRIPDNRRDTPPRLMETIKSDVRLVNPKALIPINSERALPNPYQNGNGDASPISLITRTKPVSQSTPNGRPFMMEDTYGTVFDSLDSRHRKSRSNLVEGTKLKLPPNREIVPLSPRVKSPIPSDSISTDKIIATELLKSKRAPSKEQLLSHQRLEIDIDYPDNINDSLNISNKPPIAEKPPLNLPRQETDSRRTSQTRSSNESVVLKHPNHQYMSQQNLSPRRPITPLGGQFPESPKTPQKEDMRKSVEAYYWNEIKKLKDQENYQLCMMQMQYGYLPVETARKSRSMSPVASRNGRRSLSLPREPRQPQILPEPYYPNIIPENRAVINQTQLNLQPSLQPNLQPQPRSMQQLQFQQQQYFQRSTPERSTVDGSNHRKIDGTNSLYRPIFKRGSLSTPPTRTVPEDSLKRKVSFSGGQELRPQGWPTKNGYTQSPPQRRIEKILSQGDDEVFLPQPSEEDLYYNTVRQNYGEPRYVLRASQNSLYLHQRQPIENPHRTRQVNRQEELYGQPVDAVRPLSRHGSIQIQEEIYGQRPASRRMSYQNVSPRLHSQEPQRRPLVRREIIVNDEIFGQFGGYSPSVQLQYYPPKQVSVSNRVCDFYGQIHDPDQTKVNQSGVLMGQVRGPPENFVRNGRLTSSANDMYLRAPQRYPNETLYGRIEQSGPPTRPLPPVPLKKGVISDNESGSDASEVQRIFNSSKSNKKRGIFGK
ncbi:uncharacterized protein [Euwallacea fornicatus]